MNLKPLSVWGIHDAQDPDSPSPKPSGCGWYRVVLPLRELGGNGWRVKWKAGTPPPESAAYRIVVGERLDRLEAQGHWRRMRARHRLVYEIDDDVFHVDPTNWTAYRIYGNPQVQEAVAHMCAVSDLVTVTTEPLADVMRVHNPNVAVLPNCIPARMLDLDRPRRGPLTIGWTGGASHALDVQIIAPVLRHYMGRDKNAVFHLIGTDFRPTIGLPDDRVRYTPWAPDPEDYYRLIDFDIALIPLTGTRFDMGKSSIKAVEMNALGIPVIASDTGPYRDYVIDGVNGFLVSTRRQWRERLCELAADEGLRETMGAKAKEIAAQHTIEEHWRRWADAYTPLL